MARLRDPERGCPWDVKQDFASIATYTIEEAYEVADAIARGDLDDLRDELGDLLLQVVYHARMAEEQGGDGTAGEIRLAGPITQGELAAMVGSTRQSVNKLLGYLVEDGLIRMDRDAIVVVDLSGLQRAARR